ncbi:hypothetical protein chiPu_0031243, partial [Chiloscyllium punctatum]|nr:hypothetical protein [Chiloscyllium punctatum]
HQQVEVAVRLVRADVSGTAGRLETADRLRDYLLGQPQHDLREIDGETDRDQEHDIDRQRRPQRFCKADADEFRGHQQHEPVGRRDQAECQRCDQHHAHVHAVDVAGLGQRVDQRHEDDDGRHRLDEVADHREQQHHQEHDEVRIVAGDRGDPVGDVDRAAQIGEHPAECIRGADRDQRQREDQAGEAEIVRNLLQVTAVQRRDHQDDDVGDRDYAGFGRREP